ncbi:hypothetical protein ABPG75_001991 [Micractinium tetrahymenae]
MWAPLPAQAGLEPQSAALLNQLWGQPQEGAWPGGSAAGGLVAPQLPGTPQTADAGSPSWGAASEPFGQASQGPNHAAASKLYVQGLPQNLQHPVAVAGLFSPFGDVLDVKLYAAEVRLSGGSAVVRMRNAAQAAAAIAALNGAVPDGGWQQLTVRAAETAEQRSSRITAINGRQQGAGPAPASPLQAALPPTGPAGAGAAAALRRVHSARGACSHGALQCYTAGLAADALAAALPMQLRRGSLDWAAGPQGPNSLDSSRRSSMDVARCGSSVATLPSGGGRTSSDSGSGSGSDDMPPGAAVALAGGEMGAIPRSNGGPAGGEMQRMLLEAVLALLGQVESGQLSLPAMRSALESALAAAKHQPAGGEEPVQSGSPGGGAAAQQAHAPGPFRAA